MWDRIKRVLRHRWMEESHRLIPPDTVERLKQRVAASEALHSGEIRICIEAGLPNSYLMRPGNLRTITRQRALSQFGKLRVWDTEHNNGVLIYLLLAERTIELVADRGLNHFVSAQDWSDMVQRLGLALRQGQFEDGLATAIDEVSAVLVARFPLQAGSVRPNELPDQPTLA
ncbi:MAG: TPM domain-containing protein [Rhodoferax sp.]